ncbi:response regulator [Halalkalicoccus jeotgali]|uniref:Response regulator receiver protein n=1 Tax=Halalkalicoccus jeotgali (strain DSM 18796 / CECT 7217 / JCM 14584 / KCTC 4019 / B3) TaxID=795797 RepID=D8JAI7_HALJB|nr:response regulator [Halalkalicoccus jeotgali]ADJ14709.1 response regulator receiver protein [Halalkalicoccus jeotgali B3]ELY39505.1 response regulator receiver protein [Halalkalicoccus jeotgali B3]
MSTITPNSPALDDVSVLVVEDDRDLAALYTQWLSDVNSVRTATDGEQSLELIDSETDVVVLDRQLPSLSGDDVLDVIRERDLSCQVLVASGVEPDFDLVSMEFDGYLRKPITRAELRDAIRRTLTMASYHATLREFSTLSRKRILLAEETTEADRAANEEYATLESRLADLAGQLDTIAGSMEGNDGGSGSDGLRDRR